ncbi:NAD-dependent epimerase/dehydratase family protein [Paenibacillus aceris]|uniref:Nucleoside-diphosphate-sugar epimerase n=1 Tax=Paenibacillus aceris TaxID=869555 RepID=A0ABS4I4H4_9BACL|nr:NAD-dependent epimerase/dehydratase family protein [Paenibacillus aceris]MBP1965817.1 nucleoside-diphosphate-sugar epimerase [Paenibacillus aceris]NHW34837.1 NAD-dependent epimerase/dehydratase family protein [Paenibacillus aceris]
MKTTVFGSKGFIGSHLVQRLVELQCEFFEPERGSLEAFNTSLGHVIYCAGVTSDFRMRPYDTVKAHVTYLSDLLQNARFDSFLYVSSTRIYYGAKEGFEDSDLVVNPNRSDDLFQLSKLLGESLCLNSSRNVKIARISNVCGQDFQSDNFLYSIIKDAVNHKVINLQTTLSSAKDYICIEDVVELLIKISHVGTSSMYNIASGTNTTNEKVTNEIQRLTSCDVIVKQNAAEIIFPPISTEKIQEEFAFKPLDIIQRIKQMTLKYQAERIIP